MRFALVVTNLAGGGAERSMLRLAAALARRGREVRLVLLEDRIEHDVPPGIALQVVRKTLGKGLVGKWLAARQLKRLRLEADWITISTLPYADEIAAAANLPNLWCRIANTLSAEIEQLRRSSRAKAARRLARYRRLYEGRNLVAVSEGVARDLREALGLRRAHIVRIYNGFDLTAIREAAAAPEPDLPADRFVLHAGRFMPQKRHDVLLEAWRQAALPYKLVLLTAPSDALARLIREKGLEQRVVIAGFRKNPYPWMRAAELLVLSSDREGMPNVLVEALACGTRVVSTDCPSGPREVMRGDLARYLVPPGDAQALARTMRAALAAPRPDAGLIAEEFSESHMARAYEALAQPA